MYSQFNRAFNSGFKRFPPRTYQARDDEDRLNQSRELYKNLQASPGGWQTRALQGQSQQLKRRLGENEQQFRQRAQEYERRIREGEDARSLLGSQLDDSRIQYGRLNDSFLNRMADFEKQQENEFNKYIHDPEIADQILLKKYTLDKDLAEIANRKPWDDVKKYAEQEGYTGDYKKPYKVYFEGKGTIPFPSYEEFAKRNHNKAFMRSLMPQFEKKYPQGSMDEAEYLKHLGYLDPTYSKDPVSFLKQYQPYYPFANEDTYKKYPTTDKFRDLSPASKKYLNIDQPNFENFNKIYKQKLRDKESSHLSDLQSQWERASSLNDKSIDPFATLLRDIQPKKYNEIMSEGMTPKMSESSVYSLNAPQSFFESIKSNYDWQSNARKENERDANLWKAKHDALLPSVEEYNNYRRDVSPLRREYPSLKDFQKRYWYVNLREYDRIPSVRIALQNEKRKAGIRNSYPIDNIDQWRRNLGLLCSKHYPVLTKQKFTW
jgi:hypothetical protein